MAESKRPWWDNTLFRLIAVLLACAILAGAYARGGLF